MWLTEAVKELKPFIFFNSSHNSFIPKITQVTLWIRILSKFHINFEMHPCFSSHRSYYIIHQGFKNLHQLNLFIGFAILLIFFHSEISELTFGKKYKITNPTNKFSWRRLILCNKMNYVIRTKSKKKKRTFFNLYVIFVKFWYHWMGKYIFHHNFNLIIQNFRRFFIEL